jgi:hypothetical protein
MEFAIVLQRRVVWTALSTRRRLHLCVRHAPTHRSSDSTAPLRAQEVPTRWMSAQATASAITAPRDWAPVFAQSATADLHAPLHARPMHQERCVAGMALATVALVSATEPSAARRVTPSARLLTVFYAACTERATRAHRILASASAVPGTLVQRAMLAASLSSLRAVVTASANPAGCAPASLRRALGTGVGVTPAARAPMGGSVQAAICSAPKAPMASLAVDVASATISCYASAHRLRSPAFGVIMSAGRARTATVAQTAPTRVMAALVHRAI